MDLRNHLKFSGVRVLKKSGLILIIKTVKSHGGIFEF